jgi:NAD(P)-dependent dehydrogenase (short-subunit alcohol dehydrogenase family)
MSDPRGVIVTGGTGALGRANVEVFLAAGDRVVVPWIVKAERDAIAELWAEAAAADRIRLVEADVADERGAAEVARATGEADVLVNGVGGFAGGTPVHETDLELWDHMYRINVRTAAAMSRALLPGMLAHGRGAIVNVASRAAFDCPATLAPYSAAKAALVALTRTLQNEGRAAGVRVNAVVPSTIDTAANREAMPDADFTSWTAPERIARVVHWLCSDAASSVRGSLIEV